MRLLPRRPAAQTAIVAIDEASIDRLGSWPWPRARLAEIVDRAADAGARGVVFDILLVDPRDDDDRLAAALRRIPTVAVAVLADDGKWRFPAPSLRGAARLGHGNFEFDSDGILRRFSSTKQSGERALAALAFEAAWLVRVASVPVGRTVAPAFRTRPRDIPQVSAAELLAGGRGEVLRGRIVFVGLTAVALGDRVLTPVSTDAEAGVTVQAASAESVMRGEEIREMPPIVAGLIAAILVLVPRRWAPIVFLLVAGGFLLIAPPFVTLLAVIGTREVINVARSLRHTRSELTEHRVQEAESKRVLAHELKTPLASMRGLTQLLGDFDLTDAERKRVTSLLESEAGKLQSMVTGLLDLERLPLRDFHASTAVIDLGKLVAERVEFLRASTDRPLIMQSTPNVSVRADAVLVERVVDNLVGNALKYAEGPVTVAVRGNALEVSDQGPGLDAADRERVFQRFFRGSSAAGTNGLGLGLSLVAEVAKWHGGTASAEGAPGGGTLFRVTFGAT